MVPPITKNIQFIVKKIMAWQTVLVAIDVSQSTTDHQLIQVLEGLNLKSNTQVILTHVIDGVKSDFNTVVEIPYLTVEKLLESYQEKLPYPSKIEIVRGDTAEEIIRLVNIYQVDLIIIGSRGLRGLKRILEGSVSSQVVSDAPCSVLVIKSK
jgi:nucleotide-binding universal stress UspA family protein